MTTIDNAGRPAYMYDEDDETWYAISGRVSTSANYIWTGAHQYDNNSTFNGAITAKLRINSFLNPAARTSAIPAPGVGLITFLQQDASGNTINRFEFWSGSAWVPMADQTSAQTLTNKTLTSPTINGGAINATTLQVGTVDVSTTTGTQTLTNKTLTSPTINGGSVSNATSITLTGSQTLDSFRARNIRASTSDPSGGNDGDVWIKYT